MTTATVTEVSRIITVSQIVDGTETCHCGEPAVLLVDTEPDNEPGYVCHEHYSEWAVIAARLVDRLYGPDGIAHRTEKDKA